MGNGGVGFRNVERCLKRASTIATRKGSGLVVFKNPGKVGALRIYCQEIMDRGQLIILMKNTAATVGFPGLKKPIIGTNPLCIGLPKVMGSNQVDHFIKDNGQELPFSNETYLFPFMMPTSKGTHYRNGPPAGDLMDHQKGRILLQVHQLLHLLQEYGISLKGKRLLDVGTGNGMIPQLILDLSDLKSAVGSDPYLDGETVVSWQVHVHDRAFQDMRSFLHTYCPETFDYNAYQHLLEHENYTMISQRVSLAKRRQKQYRFAKVGAHGLRALDERFDVVYAKAVGHISDWDGIFRSLAAAANEGAVLYFEHRTFFSYLGGYRRGSISIPWGHLLLNDEEYKRCVTQFYPDDAQTMIDLFQGIDISTRVSSGDDPDRLQNQFCPVVVISEPTRHIDRLSPLINDIDNFWEIVCENHPCVGADEILAGM